MSQDGLKRFHMRRYRNRQYMGNVRVEAHDVREAYERARAARDYARDRLVLHRIDLEWGDA